MNNYVVNVQHAAIRGVLAVCMRTENERGSPKRGWIAV